MHNKARHTDTLPPTLRFSGDVEASRSAAFATVQQLFVGHLRQHGHNATTRVAQGNARTEDTARKHCRKAQKNECTPRQAQWSQRSAGYVVDDAIQQHSRQQRHSQTGKQSPEQTDAFEFLLNERAALEVATAFHTSGIHAHPFGCGGALCWWRL
jgi:hypothetical protein